jgi:hypothetical protein
MFAGNVVMKGYLKNKKATEEAFAGGWFHSGDLATLDEEGYITVVDRKKDMIKTGGENVASRDPRLPASRTATAASHSSASAPPPSRTPAPPQRPRPAAWSPWLPAAWR